MGLLKATLTLQSRELPGGPRPSSAHIQYNTRGKAPTIRCWAWWVAAGSLQRTEEIQQVLLLLIA
jgi:hypothetical protein